MCYLEQMTIDPITADVIRHRFDAATDEMLVTLVKTAFSPNVKERRDCSAACFDVNGDLISLSASAPMHLSSLMGMVQNIVKRFPLESIRQGDMYLTNDPYVGGGSHLPDLTLTSPVFFEGRLVMFVATTAHHSDIGGKASGSESADCISIFQEGLRLPPVRLMAEGELRQDILDILLLNSRTPFHREGDMKAQIASNLIGVRRLEELLRRFGVETVLAGIEALFDYSEARTRAAIAKLKDGSYENEDFLDHDGVEPRMVPLKVKVTIAGDSIHFDFTGSAPQIAGARNCVMMATLACVFAAFKVVTDPALAPNAGSYRPIRVTAPEGTIMNCVPPASVGDRGRTANIVGDLLLGALAKAAPDRVMAGCGSSQALVFSGYDPRRKEYIVDYDVFAGGAGAQHDRDGMDVVRTHAAMADSTPIEATEHEFPLVVRSCELLQDSGGPGRFRGGLGMKLDVLVWAEQARLSGRGLRHGLQAPPLFGGRGGSLASYVLNPGTAEERKLQAVFSEMSLSPGAVIRVETPSGAGFGDPLERDPARVQNDVMAGKVSSEGAKRDFGVLLAAQGVDVEGTRALRARLKEERGS
ncbi:MAG TPA: hydantoinase B/oxoprolinase family protein [Burkholderiales bacterium]|nr:hydantoinase B/oxoprolinase family protein [Burkholderiales bacterium]